MVLGKAGCGITNGPDHPRLQIRLAIDKIVDGVGGGIEEQSIDREIAAGGVFLGGTEAHRIRASAVAVFAVAAEGGDIEHVTALTHQKHPEMGPDLVGTGEEREKLVWSGVGGDVKILGLPAH